jgi:glutamate carboxypeptidase
VSDAKGGLVVMLFALRAFEQFVQTSGRGGLGWEVLINADEEIGSPGSRHLFEDCAKRVQFGLLFEPTLQGGHLVSSRKGSGNFSIVVRGRSAHAGRDFQQGRNAVVAAAAMTAQLHGLNGRWPDLTLNVAGIDGGGPFNVVPDLAVVRFNIRYGDAGQGLEIQNTLKEIAARNVADGVQVSLHGEFSSPPKPLDQAGTKLLEAFRDCGTELSLDLRWQPSGGACDGNRLAACGVPNVDSLGVHGGKIHSPEEFVLLDSLPERAKLTALFLMRLADGEFSDLG